MKLILHLIAVLTLGLTMLCGCNSSDPDEGHKYVAFNIVTYEGTSESGVTTFSFYAIDDSPMLTLTCKWVPDKPLERGTRLLVAYATDTPGESGPITLKAVSLIYGNRIVVGSGADDWSTEKVWVNSIWRTGPYINLDCLMQYASGKRVLELSADSTTFGSACPVFYLEARGVDNPVAPFDQRIYGSWDIDSVWNLPGVTGIKVCVNDQNRGIDEVIFNKTEN